MVSLFLDFHIYLFICDSFICWIYFHCEFIHSFQPYLPRPSLCIQQCSSLLFLVLHFYVFFLLCYFLNSLFQWFTSRCYLIIYSLSSCLFPVKACFIGAINCSIMFLECKIVCLSLFSFFQREPLYQ